MKKYLFAVIIFCCSTLSAQPGWVYLNPTPTASSLTDLTMFTETSGICRGSNSIFKTNNGGTTWTEYNLANSEMYITGFSMVDSSSGYIGTGPGNILRTTNGGINWNFVSQVSYSYRVKFISLSTGFLLGRGDNVRGKIFKTTNSGLNWRENFLDENISLNDLCFVSSYIGFATGTYYFPNGATSAKILKTTNAGESWDTIPNSLNLSPHKIFFLNENTGFISGQVASGNRILRTTNGGLSWGDTLKYNLYDIRFSDANTGYFINGDSILGRTTNAGMNWSISKIRNSTINYYTYPNSIYFQNQTTAICIGSLGLNLKTTDNGNTWINYNNSFTMDELDDIIFKDANTGFAMGFTKNIFKTTNAGVNWETFPVGNNNTAFGAMAFAGGNTWFLTDYFDNTMYKTTNDGLNWNMFLPGFGGVTALQFLNENTGFGVCKYNTFVKTTNGGLNWFKNTNIGSQNFTVNFIDENTGYVGGEWKLRKTTNGGVTFDTIPQSIIYGAWDMKFVSRDILFVSGASENMGSAIWKSTNGGDNWAPYYLPASNYLSGPLRFPNANTGYVCNHYGEQFKTTNAGDNWFQIKAPDGGTLYGMNFINSETGYIVGDHGIIAKTTNGGNSTFINNPNEEVVNSFSLYQNYPNPFNPSTKIKFDLPQNGSNNIPVKIIIFDILGREMETLLDEKLTAGVHEVNWNASKYAAGVYFYMLLTDGIKETKKMILVK